MKIIHKMKFTTQSSATKNKWLFSHKIDYIVRDEAVKNNKNSFLGYISRTEKKSSNKTIFKNNNENQILYFIKDGYITSNDTKMREEIIQKFDHNQQKKLGCLYSHIVSFDQETYKQIKGNYTEYEAFNLIKPAIEQMLLNEGFDLNNITYAASFHTNTNNLHIHLEFVENTPTREKNKFKEKSSRIFKREISKNIYSSKRETLLNNIENSRQNARNFIKENKLKSNKKTKKAIKLINRMETKPRYYGDLKDENLINLIDSIATDILDNDTINSYFEELKNFDDFNNNNKYSTNKKEEFEKFVKNQVLKNLKSQSYESKLRTYKNSLYETKINKQHTKKLNLLHEDSAKYLAKINSEQNKFTYDFERK